jgi:hypothetical protein
MADQKTLYEVLGVSRRAKANEIGLAYQRLRTTMQKEASAPDPRRAAMAKVAYETLSDPARRAEYDATLEEDDDVPPDDVPPEEGRRVRRKRPARNMAMAAVVVIAAGAAGYWFLLRTPARVAQGENALSAGEIVQAVASHVARLQGALMSGEVRDLGMAVDIGDNEMVAPCRGIAAGMTLEVKQDKFSAPAEVTRSNPDLDVCTLGVKAARGGIKMRPGIPGPQEKLQAVLVGLGGQPEARQVTVGRTAKDAKGALEVKSAATLPPGTPLFDAQARLVGIVAAAPAAGGGIVAWDAARIAQARGAATGTEPAAASAKAPKEPARAAPEPARAASEPAQPAPSIAASPQRGPRGTMVDEGFATLWKEDRLGALIEVMDHPKTGAVGDPIAYWTRWKGRDVASDPQTHCMVTFGDDDEIVADYDQIPHTRTPDGYWYCALTRFQVNLDDLPVGEYHFTISVDGQDVAEGSARIEKKFWTRDKYAFIVIVLGGVLLWFARRKRS